MRRILVFITFMGAAVSIAAAQDGKPKPQKYALLVAVREYDHPEMNEPLLAYPEIDARSMHDLLYGSGYIVDVLLGKDATQANIRKKLAAFAEKGGNKGVVVVGLFGHGIEFESTRKSYFCPFDTPLKAKRDSNGRPLSNDNGTPKMEPNEEKLIAIDEVLLALRESKATNRILLADCCRNDPNAARGRSFGTSLEINQLPKNTAVLFACSAQEKAYEHKEWGHGAFTKCLLESIQENVGRGKSLMGSIAEDVEPAVEKLVASKVDATQTPRLLATGARIDLQLASLSVPQPPRLSPPTTKPFTTTKPSTPKPSTPEPTKSDLTSGRGFEGTKAGDAKELVPGISFRWCPAGTFTMGTPGATDEESPVSRTLTSGYWLGETEVTQGQWTKFMRTTPWSGKEHVKDGLDYAASHISYDDAVEFCKQLTTQERGAGRLPQGWKYSLPSEAQWEYGCRAGTETKYSFGESESQLGEYGWFTKNADEVKEQYAHPVGRKKPNAWGLRDMHGNVSEWCSDKYADELDSDQVTRGIRGGSWWNVAGECRSAYRFSYLPDYQYSLLGFRLAAVPE